jgi:hypothetical protein
MGVKLRLRVFEKRVLRIFAPKRDEIIAGCRKLHELLHDLYASFCRMRLAEYVTRM